MLSLLEGDGKFEENGDSFRGIWEPIFCVNMIEIRQNVGAFLADGRRIARFWKGNIVFFLGVSDSKGWLSHGFNIVSVIDNRGLTTLWNLKRVCCNFKFCHFQVGLCQSSVITSDGFRTGSICIIDSQLHAVDDLKMDLFKFEDGDVSTQTPRNHLSGKWPGVFCLKVSNLRFHVQQ